MIQRIGLAVLLLLAWCLPVYPQGQSINGDRTVAGGFNAGTATGAVNAYVLTLSPALTGYLDRQCYLFKANLANTSTTPTLNVNGLGAKTIQKRVAGVATALAANDIGLGQYVYACYDGTVMQCLSCGGGGSGSGNALTTNPLSQFAATTSAELAGVLTDENGTTGGFVRQNGNVATASAFDHDPTACPGGQFANDISAAGVLTCSTPAGGGNVSSTGTPTAGLTAEWTSSTVIQGIAGTGSGLYVKQTNPTLIGPTLGAALATTINKVAFTTPATGSTLTIADGKTATVNNTLTLTGTDGSTVAFGTGGTAVYQSRLLNTTAPLAGGGDHSADRTITCTTCATKSGTLTNTHIAAFDASGNIVDGVHVATNLPTLSGTNAWTGRQDASGAASTSPLKFGTTPPGTCIIGDYFFDTDATPGSNTYACTATNTWTLQGDGSGSGDILVSGEAVRSIGALRRTGATNPGLGLTIPGGGAASASTDQAGGNLVLRPGISTGTGRSWTSVQCAVPATASGTGDTVFVDCILFGVAKRITNNVATAMVSLTLANNTSVGVKLDYTVKVSNAGGVQQIETGSVTCSIVNVAGAFSRNTCQKFADFQAISDDPSSTLLVEWLISAANPAVVTARAASSLTPSSGFPLVDIKQVTNLASQAMTIP